MEPSAPSHHRLHWRRPLLTKTGLPKNVGSAPSTQGKATVGSIPLPPLSTTIVIDKDRQRRRQRQQSAPSAPSHRRLRQRRPPLTKTTDADVADNNRHRRLHPPPPPLTTTVVKEDCQCRRQRQRLAPTAPSHRLLCGGQPASTKTSLQANAGLVPSPQGKATIITTM